MLTGVEIKKVLLFGLLGAVGCLVGWLLGEGFLPVVGREAAPSLVSNPELERRLQLAGAKTGDVQISLMWQNRNDLDLHCIDPSGEEVYFANKRSRSRGELDVDRNATLPFTREPVENIYWPQNGAPKGHYRVFVNHFANHGDPDPTDYSARVIVEGRQQALEGSVSFGQPKKLIYEFEVGGAATSRWSWFKVPIMALWTALLAVGLGLALVMGQNHYLARTLITPRQSVLVVGGGLAAGALAGAVGETLSGLLTAIEFVGQFVGWIMLGGLLGRGMGFFIPNLNPWRALAAGAIGGFIGALAFIAVSSIAGLLIDPMLGLITGRFSGAAILGFAIGSMVALVEVTFRKAWLEVAYGPREVGTVNLGVEPITIGSDRTSCTICALGAPPLAFRYALREGQILCEDVVQGNSATVQPGDHRVIGSIEVTVRGGVDSAAVSNKPSSLTGTAPSVSGTVASSDPPAASPPAPDPGRAEKLSPQSAKTATSEDACPTCGQKAPGTPGKRYCLICERSF